MAASAYHELSQTHCLALGCIFFACCNIIRASWKSKKETTDLQKKVHIRICLRNITFLAICPPSYVFFCCFFRLLALFHLPWFYVEKNCAPEIGGGTGEIFFQGETITNYVLQLYRNRDSGTGGFSVNFPKILIPPLQKCNFSKCVIWGTG